MSQSFGVAETAIEQQEMGQDAQCTPNPDDQTYSGDVSSPYDDATRDREHTFEDEVLLSPQSESALVPLLGEHTDTTMPDLNIAPEPCIGIHIETSEDETISSGDEGAGEVGKTCATKEVPVPPHRFAKAPKIVLAPARPKDRPATILSRPFKSPSSSPPSDKHASITETRAPSDALHKSEPLTSAYHRNAGMTGAKPFKTPMKRSAPRATAGVATSPPSKLSRTDQSSPPSSVSSSSYASSRRSNAPKIGLLRTTPTSSASSRSSSDKQQLQTLQNQVQTLRDAIKWLEQPEEADKLRTLIDQWLVAGREVADLLFAITPKPDETGPTDKQGWSNSRPPSFLSFSTSGNIFPGLSEAQREFLDRAPKNDDGDPCDAEGNPLLPDEDFKLSSLLQQRASIKLYGNRANLTDDVPLYGSPNTEEAPTRDDNTSVTNNSWNVGNMLRTMRLEFDTPTILGWNEDDEDWA